MYDGCELYVPVSAVGALCVFDDCATGCIVSGSREIQLTWHTGAGRTVTLWAGARSVVCGRYTVGNILCSA